jgi:hypothetical protein
MAGPGIFFRLGCLGLILQQVKSEIKRRHLRKKNIGLTAWDVCVAV